MGKGLRYEQRRLNQHDRRPNPVCIPCRRRRRIRHPGHPRRSPAHRPATALPVGHQRCRMADPRPARAGRDRTRPADHLPPPRHRGRDPLPRPHRLPVGRAAGRLPPPQAGLPLLQDLDRATERSTACTTACGNRSANRSRAVTGSRRPRWSTPSRYAARTPSAGPSRGYDAGKKVNGRKRHIAVDTCGLLLAVLVTAASVQDRDGARPLLWALRRLLPHHPPGLGRRRLRRPARRLGRHPPRPDRADRRETRRADHLRRPAPQMGGRTHLLLDQPVPTHRPRLRTATRPPRRDGPVGHDHRHDPTPRPPPTT